MTCKHLRNSQPRHHERSEGSRVSCWRSLATLGMTEGNRNVTWGVTHLLLLCAAIALMACSKIDDYFLGKDNLLIPHDLPPVTAPHPVTFQPLWKVPLKGHFSGDKLIPAVRSGLVYLASSEGQLQAYDLKTGELRWQQSGLSGFVSGPIIGKAILALGTRRSSVVVVSRKTGALVWEKKLSSPLLSSPLLAGDKVITKTIDGRVTAFNMADGKMRWQVPPHSVPELMLKASASPVMLNSQQILIGLAEGKLEAIDVNTGQVMWDKTVLSANGASEVERVVDIDADPIVRSRGILLGTYQGVVGEFSPETDTFNWQHPASVYKNMLFYRQQLYFTDEHDVIWALDHQNGRVLWKQTALQARNVTSPVGVKAGILLGDKTGWVHVLSPQEGTLIGRLAIAGGVVTPPVAVEEGRVILVISQKGQLSAWKITHDS